MPDFSQLLKKPAGEHKKPPALPAGQYPGLVKSYEIGDQNKNHTPYVRFQLGLTSWADGVPEEDKTAGDTPVDLSKKQLRRDFFFTDDALWRLDDFIKSCGIVASGRSYEEILPEIVGLPVMVEVQQYMNQTNSEIGNQVGQLVGQS